MKFHFGDLVKKCRLEHNLTQDDLAKELFLTRLSVFNYESHIQDPSLSVALRIADFLGFSLDNVKFVRMTTEQRVEKRKKDNFASQLERLMKLANKGND